MELHKILLLPGELRRVIASYIGYPETHTALLINEELRIYENDHGWYQTQIYGKPRIYSIFSFSKYYFHKKTNPTQYLGKYDSICPSHPQIKNPV
jgi:hypothetical protein